MKRILLYRVDFSDSVGAAISSNAAAVLVSDLNDYYKAMSYGLIEFSWVNGGSVVTETLRLPEPSTAYDNSFTKFIAATRQVAVQAGYNPADFDLDIICTGSKPGAFFGGIANVGGPGVWIANGNFNIGVVGHELGHNFGLPHASLWNTGDQSSIGPGVRGEYGDLFDSMGVPGGNSSHFNTRFKSLLGWIPENDAPFIMTNGTYRIFAHDHPDSRGLRALRIKRDDDWNYWVEFRQSFNNRYVTNGATLRWAGNDATNSLLLDVTPGTPAQFQDSPLLIGRTFSDRCMDVHVTPIAKAGTNPESLDIVVNRGPFPSNLSPVVSVSASATSTTSNTVIALQAVASDANGDALAYYWDFGDGNYGGNQSSINYAWTRDGEYVVRCSVTDMKGGTASASVIVRVGVITTFLVSGRVLMDGAPVEGVLIKAGSRFGYTESDGAYHISRVNAGRPTLSGVMESFNILNAGFENPVTVGPSVTELNFIAISDSFNSFSLITTSSVWSYLDTGVPPALNWMDSSYQETGWKTGQAKLGYGVGDESTTIGFGTNTSNRHITTWLRQRFVVEEATAIDYLVFKIRRDDGARLYLNGHELYRENLPAGVIQHVTRALVDVGSAEEQTIFARVLPPERLVTGTNILAVEVHQYNTNSPDLSFALELVALTDDAVALQPYLTTGRSDTNLSLSWPRGFGAWHLYTAEDLAPTTKWRRQTSSFIAMNGSNSLTLPLTNGRAFYELRRQRFCEPFQ